VVVAILEITEIIEDIVTKEVIEITTDIEIITDIEKTEEDMIEIIVIIIDNETIEEAIIKEIIKTEKAQGNLHLINLEISQEKEKKHVKNQQAKAIAEAGALAKGTQETTRKVSIRSHTKPINLTLEEKNLENKKSVVHLATGGEEVPAVAE